MSGSAETLADLGRIGQPQQHPASLTVRGEADLAGNNEPLPADALAHDRPASGDLAGQVADVLLREDLDGVGVGAVPGFGFEHEGVLADSRDVALVVVGAFDRGVDGSAAEFEVSAHGGHATEPEAVAS